MRRTPPPQMPRDFTELRSSLNPTLSKIRFSGNGRQGKSAVPCGTAPFTKSLMGSGPRRRLLRPDFRPPGFRAGSNLGPPSRAHFPALFHGSGLGFITGLGSWLGPRPSRLQSSDLFCSSRSAKFVFFPRFDWLGYRDGGGFRCRCRAVSRKNAGQLMAQGFDLILEVGCALKLGRR